MIERKNYGRQNILNFSLEKNASFTIKKKRTRRKRANCDEKLPAHMTKSHTGVFRMKLSFPEETSNWTVTFNRNDSSGKIFTMKLQHLQDELIGICNDNRNHKFVHSVIIRLNSLVTEINCLLIRSRENFEDFVNWYRQNIGDIPSYHENDYEDPSAICELQDISEHCEFELTPRSTHEMLSLPAQNLSSRPSYEMEQEDIQNKTSVIVRKDEHAGSKTKR
ncbi:hypothetical protein SK128_028129 [Halocaridina rubra]|uniref:Uncharacterized protein n=1 Tax=Halocaridina rubra TaxID=373956 RepID=A0AAN8WIA7_HALRR